jgi:ribosome-binding factor A
MSQRVAKIESLIQQVVATSLVELVGPDAARVTVTRVDAAPDLHNATVWVGILGDAAQAEAIMKRLQQIHSSLQAALSRRLQTKFVPRLHVRQDTGGEYAAEIDRLLKNL